MELNTEKRELCLLKDNGKRKKLKIEDHENIDVNLYYEYRNPIVHHHSFISVNCDWVIHIFENPYVMEVTKNRSDIYFKATFIKIEKADYANLEKIIYNGHEFINVKYVNLLFNKIMEHQYIKTKYSSEVYDQIIYYHKNNNNLERNYIYEKINGDGYLELYFLNFLYIAIEILSLEEILKLRLICKRFSDALYPYYFFYRTNASGVIKKDERVLFSPSVHLTFWFSYNMNYKNDFSKLESLENGSISSHSIHININEMNDKWILNLNVRHLRVLSLYIDEEDDEEDEAGVTINCRNLKIFYIVGLYDRVPVLENHESLIKFSFRPFMYHNFKYATYRTNFMFDLLEKCNNLKKLYFYPHGGLQNEYQENFSKYNKYFVSFPMKSFFRLEKLETSSWAIRLKDLETLLHYLLFLKKLVYQANFHSVSISIDGVNIPKSTGIFGWTKNEKLKPSLLNLSYLEKKENIDIEYVKLNSDFCGYLFSVESNSNYECFCPPRDYEEEFQSIKIPLLEKLEKLIFINCKFKTTI